MLSPGLASLLEETGSFTGKNFLSEPKLREERLLNSKILIIGAGGLGCELLKSLAFNGFKHIDIIDMDQVDVSNLNRQFLFRKKDVGRYKSEVAAEYVRNRIMGRFPPIKDAHGNEIKEGIEINHKTCYIQDLGDDYYKQFDLVIGGLDNINARFWMNNKLVKICKKTNKCIPYIDGGTTSWGGQATVIYPNHTACLYCEKDSWKAPQKEIVMCTAATTPRKPEHCIYYAHKALWPKNKGKEIFDIDNEDHVTWVTEKANEHAKKFKLKFEIDNKATRRFIKNIVPAIASTQAIIASICCTEAFKILSDRAPFLNNKIDVDVDKNVINFINYNGNSDFCGTNFGLIQYNRVETCQACTDYPTATFNPEETVADLTKKIEEKYNLKTINLLIFNNKYILVDTKSHKKRNKENLAKEVKEIGIKNESFVQIGTIADETINLVLYQEQENKE